MTTRYFGERIRRNEDPRLLTGGGTFIDDLRPAGVVHAAFLRSPHAHARVVSINTAQAAQPLVISSQPDLTVTSVVNPGNWGARLLWFLAAHKNCYGKKARAKTESTHPVSL